MPMACDSTSLNNATGQLQPLSPRELKALLVLYLYHQVNPSSVGTVISASTVLSNVACFKNCYTHPELEAFKVWVARQSAIDAGVAEPAFSVSAARKAATQLVKLSDLGLHAAEVYYRCLIS